MSEPRRWTLYVPERRYAEVRVIEPGPTYLGMGESIEVMPVSEHEEIVASLNQSEPGCAYFTSPAMKRLADEHAAEVANLTEEIDLVSDQRDSLVAENERLEKAAQGVVDAYVQSDKGALIGCIELLRTIVPEAPVNPQEDER